eukprot:3485696-Prymnesium_polylepis.1
MSFEAWRCLRPEVRRPAAAGRGSAPFARGWSVSRATGGAELGCESVCRSARACRGLADRAGRG